MRLPAKLALTIIASLGASWFLWSGLLTSLPPAPIPPTPFERQFGFNVRPDVIDFLNQRLPSPMVLKGTIEQIVEALREFETTKIFVDWHPLRPMGFIRPTTHESTVTLDVSGKSFGDALLALLAKATNPKSKFDCVVDGRIIRILQNDPFAKSLSTRAYDVRDLFGSPLAQPPSMKPDRSQFPSWLTSRRPKTSTPQEENALIQQVLIAIDPPSWRTNGGRIQSPSNLAGQLIVTQTEANQRDLQTLLHRLRWRRRLLTIALRTAILTAFTIALCLLAHLMTRQRRLARARRSAGLCLSCGYDLRATPNHCPECGATSENVSVLQAGPPRQSTT